MKNKRKKQEHKGGYRKEEDRKIVAVPDYFLDYCINKTTCKEHKKDLIRYRE